MTSKIKLDEIVDGIKNFKTNFSIAEDLKVAIKIMKRMRMSEACKWNSELLTSFLGINFNSDLQERTTNEKGDTLGTPFNNFPNQELYNLNQNVNSSNTKNITLKNLNSIFNRPENFNFSSILLNSDTSNNPELDVKTPEGFANILNMQEQKNNFSNLIDSSHEILNQNFNSYNKGGGGANQNLQGPTNKFVSYYNKIKYDEFAIKDIISYAGVLFDLKEYTKCSYVVKSYAVNKYPTAMYLYYHCEYLLISQRQQEELLDNSDFGSNHFSSEEMNKLYQTLKSFADSKDEKDEQLSPFILYLYGTVLKSLNRMDEARQVLLRCLNMFPFMWYAWIELSSITKGNEIKSIFSELEDHWMKYFYLAHFLLEKMNEQESLIISSCLLQHFPNSIFLLNTMAHCHYSIHEYESAIDYFEKLLSLDPHRYENIDSYSNILYIKENYCELSNLAFKCFQNDKYRPETCTVIGNYYALKGDHAKAVVYFKRAVKLDYNYLPAWTLMGHEYMEMKNIPAAVESYRTAVDLDANDNRAWYGLGQVYELSHKYSYALYYFLKAALAKPNDSRMWTALGTNYERLDRKTEAIKCYEKALNCKDREGVALLRMAKLYFMLGDEDKAALCFQENLKCNASEGEIDNADTVESLFFLAKYHKKRADYGQAYSYLLKLKDHEGVEKDEIQFMMREVTVLRANLLNSHINRNNITGIDD